MTRLSRDGLQTSVVLAILGGLVVAYGIESLVTEEAVSVWVPEVAFGACVLFAAFVLAVWEFRQPTVAVGPFDTWFIAYLVGFGPALVAGIGLYVAGYETLRVVGLIVVGGIPIGLQIALSLYERGTAVD